MFDLNNKRKKQLKTIFRPANRLHIAGRNIQQWCSRSSDYKNYCCLYQRPLLVSQRPILVYYLHLESSAVLLSALLFVHWPREGDSVVVVVVKKWPTNSVFFRRTRYFLIGFSPLIFFRRILIFCFGWPSEKSVSKFGVIIWLSKKSVSKFDVITSFSMFDIELSPFDIQLLWSGTEN